MFRDEPGGSAGDDAVVRQDEAVTRLSHRKMLRRVRSGIMWDGPRTCKRQTTATLDLYIYEQSVLSVRWDRVGYTEYCCDGV